ncbi:MAG: NAD(P)H-dependent oxidoreductase [Gemmatimonadota bacterium]|nr:MAG: NAD(P)H-dependent oxidoreductase [Gemmatimonadota bacterium]
MTETLYLPVIVGSTRRGRQTPRVALFMHRRLAGRPGVESRLLDLAEYALPIMEERLHKREDPPPGLEEFGEQIRRADALLIVTPEYNSGYPGVLKNALDYLLPQYRRKPVGIVTVSAGPWGGLSALSQLRQVLLSLGALPIPARLPVERVDSTFTAAGDAADPAYERRADRFIDELLWYTEALAARRALDRDEQTDRHGR